MDPSDGNRDLPLDEGLLHPSETIAIGDSGLVGDDGELSVREIPKRFGRYEIVSRLGSGAMGAVYKARDTQLERIVAIKTPKFSGDDNQPDLERFYREARSAATLCHPNICQIYDVGEIDGIHYISMAFVDGLPLSRYISSESPHAMRRIAGILRKCALALEEAHSKGIVHRDLKPANVMIDRRGEPIIMDFGLAWRVDSEDGRLTKNGVILGTPAYMSPEQLDGQPDSFGPRADVYSLGVMMYELLTGSLPFPGNGSVMSIIRDIVSKQPSKVSELRPDVPPSLEAICHRAMSLAPDDRYPRMQDFAADLTRFLRGELIDEQPPTSSTAQSDDSLRSPAPAIDPTASAASSPAGAVELVVYERVSLDKLQQRADKARQCYRDQNYADAAVILEAMSQLNDPAAIDYVQWARQELPKAQAKARQQVRTTSSLRQPEHPTVSTPRQALSKSRTPLPQETSPNPSGYARKVTSPAARPTPPMPAWAFWVIAAPVAVLILLVLAMLLTSFLG
jgi:serine/threonine protein kinase